MTYNIICINDHFVPEWEIYFKKQGIRKPIKDSIYSIREFVNFPTGDKGILLNEIVNKETPRISPTTGLEGKSEQAWAVTRFTDLQGKPLLTEEIKKVEKPVLILTEEKEDFNILKTI